MIAHSFVNFIWDSCVYGGNLNWNDYFGITAEWIGGGDNRRKSVSKKTDEDYAQAFQYLDNGQVCMNGTPVGWKDMNDIIEGIESNFDDKWTVISVAHKILDAINEGEDFEYSDQWTQPFTVTIQKSYVPNYLGFKDMVGKMRNTRDNTKIFKE